MRFRSSWMMMAVVLGGCGNGDGNPAERAQSSDVLPDRPETVQDTIMIEGIPEVVTARLVRTPADFPLPFSTYVAEGIDVEHPSSDDDGITFRAAFAGVAEPFAYMHVVPYPEGTDLRGARDLVGEFLRSRLPNDDPLDTDDMEDTWQLIEAPAWAVEAYSFDYQWSGEQSFVGRITIARHDSTLFHVITHYPPEYGDGLGPRFQRILDHWQWQDTGARLGGN